MDDLSPPLVSVIMPTYRRPALALRAIKSVARQTYPNVELLVVDDDSGDETEKKVKEFFAGHPDLRGTYLLLKNGGPSVARNAGVNASHGEYLVFLDDDDILFPDFIKETLSALGGADASYGAASSDYIAVDGHTWKTYEIANFENVLGPIARSTMFRRKIFFGDELRFDPALRSVEDLDFGMRFFKKYKALAVHRPLNEYFLRAPSFGSSKVFLSGNYQNLYENFILILRRYASDIALRKDMDIIFTVQAGNLAAKAGRMDTARVHFRRALSLHCSAMPLFEYLLTYLGRSIFMACFISMWHINRTMHILKSRGKIKKLEREHVL
jgi:glycosyltransferase involved in cell wall biosynthesis